jgi:hypothetical protein
LSLSEVMDINPDGAHITLRQEEISYAYMHAIAAVAGYAIVPKPRIMDSAGIDVSIEAPGESYDCLSPIIDAQVKCTYKDCIKDGEIHYPITAKTYKRLSHKNPYKKQILVVVLVSKKLSDWVIHGKKFNRISTLVRASAYWISLEGWPEINQKHKTIFIPVTNRFTSETVKILMAKAGAKEKL